MASRNINQQMGYRSVRSQCLMGALGALAMGAVAVSCADSGSKVGSGSAQGGTGGSANLASTGGDATLGAGGSSEGSRTVTSVDGDLEVCATSTQEVALIPLDLGLLVDTSTSMDYDEKWIKVSGAISILSQSSRYANVGMALQFFPVRLACDEASYAVPVVPMATLPDVGAALRTALSAQRMSGGTPLVQALRGMGQYLTGWAAAHTDHRTVLVVATDGIPDSTCLTNTPPNTLSEAVNVAAALSGGTFYTDAPQVPVFVIGVGDELEDLNAIAAAGGSVQATLMSAGSEVESQFIAALDAIRAQTMTCDYPISQTSEEAIDYGAVNVTFTQDSSTTTLLYVPTANDCSSGSGLGWYYDDPTSPTKVILCPDICETVSTATSGAVSVVFGCERVDAPIIY